MKKKLKKKKVKKFEEEARLTRQYIVTVYQFHNKICFVLRSWTKLQKLISDKFCSISIYYRCTTAIKLNWLWYLCLYGRFCYFITFAMKIIEWKVIHYAIPSKWIWTFKYYPSKQFSFAEYLSRGIMPNYKRVLKPFKKVQTLLMKRS